MISTYKPSQNPSENLSETEGRSRIDLTHLMNRGINRVLRIGVDEILNTGEPTIIPSNPARELSILAKNLKSEAIDESGEHVDYTKLAKSDAYLRFKEFTYALPKCNITDLGDHDEQMAFWINLYNALIIDAVIHYQIKDSVLSMPSFFRRAAYNVGGYRFSADDIEHGILRRNRPHPYLRIRPFGNLDPVNSAIVEFLDARLHFALVCGALSCPPIAFYDGAQLDEQLSISASSFINGGGAFYDPNKSAIWLSKIFKWYQADFGGWDGVRAMVCKSSSDPELCEAFDLEGVRVKYQPYDWSINGLL